MTCRHCFAEIEPIFRERTDTPHDGELRCPDCMGFLGWRKKEKNERKRDGKIKIEALGVDYCQICLRTKEQLGTNETLEVHHIDENPLHDERLNLLGTCTMCHKWIHHTRTYVHEHLKPFYENRKVDIQYLLDIVSGKIRPTEQEALEHFMKQEKLNDR